MAVDIEPTENRDQHMKFYGEKSLKSLVTKYQAKRQLPSESAALRELVIRGLDYADSL